MTQVQTVPSYLDRIKANHAHGTLLAHMFEFETKYGDRYAKDLTEFCAAMNGVPGRIFVNRYHDFVSSDDGIAGLPTSALKAGFPARVWTDHSQFGFLLDGAEGGHVNPLLVHSSDGYSRVKDTELRISGKERFEGVASAQGFPLEKPLDMTVNTEARIAMARGALKEYWKIMADRGWGKPVNTLGDYAELNEINVIAHLKGVIGIIVSENPDTRTAELSISPTIAPKKYAHAVHDAAELRDWLHDTYPTIFPEKLPILSYNRHRQQNQLIPLSEAQIRRPQLPGTHRGVGAVLLARFSPAGRHI